MPPKSELYFGVEFPTQSQVVLNTMKNNNLEKYGVEHVLQVEEFRDKGINTCLQKYGVESYTQTKECQDKIKQTCLEKYGVESYSQTKECQDKTKQTCLYKYGTESFLQTEEFKEKSKLTCLKKYGTEYSIQTTEIMEKASKNAYKLKDYIFPSGKIEKIQGYEHYALNELIMNEKINETYIFTGCKNVPTIWYNDENGKKHRHYVDIFIKSQNRCIEVKSIWTAQKKKDNIFLHLLTFQTPFNFNYYFIIIIK